MRVVVAVVVTASTGIIYLLQRIKRKCVFFAVVIFSFYIFSVDLNLSKHADAFIQATNSQ